MTTKNRMFTFDEHEKLGENLQGINNYLMEIECLIHNTYGKTHKATKKARIATNAISTLRCVLDDIVCSEHPEKPDSLVVSVYYRNSTKKAILDIS